MPSLFSSLVSFRGNAAVRLCLAVWLLLAAVIAVPGTALAAVAPPAFTKSPEFVAGQGWRLTWSSEAGTVYRIDRSDDLFVWTEDIGRVTASGSSSSFVDTNSTAFTRRFWRIVSLDAPADTVAPTIGVVDARVVLADGVPVLQLRVSATDNTAVVGVAFTDAASSSLGDGSFDATDALWKLTQPLPTDSFAVREVLARARDAANNSRSSAVARFTLFDVSRFSALDSLGQPVRGAPVSLGADGRLGPLEFRPGGGGALGAGADLALRFPAGARVVQENGQSVLEFTQISAVFGKDSPLSFSTALSTNHGTTPRRVRLGAVSVTDLENAFGRAAGSGLPVRAFGLFDFVLRSGVFSGEGIVAPVLESASAALASLPKVSAAFAGFRLDFSDPARLRLPYHGELELPDGTATPPKLRVPAENPLWLELRADGSLALDGRAELTVPSTGLRMRVRVRIDDPLYQLRVSTDGFEVPMVDTLADLLPAPPASVNTGALDAESSRLTALARAYRAFSAGALGAAPISPTAAALADGAPASPPDGPATLASLLDAWTETLAAGVNGTLAGPQLDALRAFAEYAARSGSGSRDLRSILEDLDAVLALRFKAAAQASALNLDARLAELETAALARASQPGVGNSMADVSATLRALLNARALYQQLGRTEPPALVTACRTLLANFLGDLTRSRGVVAGQFSPTAGSPVATLNRFAAMQNLRDILDAFATAQALGLQASAGDYSGFDAPVGELVNQLGVRIATDVNAALTSAETARDYRAFLYAFQELVDLIALRQLGAFPTAGSTHLTTAGLPDTITTALMERLAAALAADQGKPLEERSWFDKAAEIRRLGAILEKVDAAGSALVFTPTPFVRAFNRMETALADATSSAALASTTDVRALVDLLRGGTLHDRLGRRFAGASGLTVGVRWDNVRLPDVVTRLRTLAAGTRDWSQLYDASRALIDEASQLKLESAKAGANLSDIATRRARYLNQAALLLATNQTVAQAIWASVETRRNASGLGGFDLLLPGDLKIVEPWGAVSFNRITGDLAGSIGGKVEMPGLVGGTRLDILGMTLTNRGGYDLSVAGRIDGIPFGALSGSLEVLKRRPLHVSFREGSPVEVEGSARLTLSNGLFFEGYVDFSDPLYRFGIAAGGVRFDLANEVQLMMPPTIDFTTVPQNVATAWSEYLRQLGGAIEPLADIAQTPLLGQPGMPPEFADPVLTFRYADVGAWLAGLQTDASLATAANASRFLGFVSEHLSNARKDLGVLSDRLEVQRELASLGELNKQLSGIVGVYARAGRGADITSSPELRAYVADVEARTRQLLAAAQPGITATDARQLLKTVLNANAVVNSLGDTSTLIGAPGFSTVLNAALDTALDQAGLSVVDGTVANASRFEARSRVELLDLLGTVLDLNADMALGGAESLLPRTQRAMFEIVRRLRTVIAGELAATAADDWRRRLELQQDLVYIAHTVELAVIDGDPSFKQALTADLDAAVREGDALTRARERDIAARGASPFYSLWASLGDALRRLGGTPPQLTEIQRTRAEREMRDDLAALGPLLNAVSGGPLPDLGAGLVPLIDTLAAAQTLLGDTSPVFASARTKLIETSVTIPGVAAGQRAWWEISEYSRLVGEALSTRPALIGTAAGSALRQSLNASLTSGFALLNALKPELRANRPLDIKLPGDLVLRRAFGDFAFRRATPGSAAVFTGTLGGKIEFPEAKVAGQPLRINAQGTLSTTGAFSVSVEGQNIALNGDEVFLDVSATVAGSVSGALTVGNAGGTTRLHVKNHHAGATPEYYLYDAQIAWQPGRLAFSGTSTQPLDLDPSFTIFSPGISLLFVGENFGRIAVQGDLGLWSQGRDVAPAGPSTSDFQLVFSNVEVAFAYDASGFTSTLTKRTGTPSLNISVAPQVFGGFALPVDCTLANALPSLPANPNPVVVSLTGSPSFGLRVDYGAAGAANRLRFSALPPQAISLSNFGFEVPGAPGVKLAVCSATLVLPTTAGGLPAIGSLTAAIEVPIPATASARPVETTAAAGAGSRILRARINGESWRLDGRPPEGITIALSGEIPVVTETGFTAKLVPDTSLPVPLGLDFDTTNVGANTRTDVAISGLLRVQLDAGILDDAATGQALGAGIGGRLGLTAVTRPDLSVVSLGPIVDLGTAEISGRFRIGGDQGLLIRGTTGANSVATLRLSGLSNLFDLSPARPFSIALTGAGEIPGLFAFTLNQAEIKFIGAGGPLFGVNEAALASTGVDFVQLLSGELMPLRITKVGFGLFNGNLPITGGAFAPTNLKFIVSGGLKLNIPGFDEPTTPSGPPVPTIEGDVKDFTIGFPHGFDHLPSVSASAFRLALKNLTIGDLGGITGTLAVGNIDDPQNLIIAGEAGAAYNGVGVKLLIAVAPDGLIGVCLSANAGPAGIPIDGGTLGGVLLTGAEGGVKFRGGFGDPCEFGSYLSFLGDGTPLFDPPAPPATNRGEAQDFVGPVRPPTVGDYVALSWAELARYNAAHERARLERELLSQALVEVAPLRQQGESLSVATSLPTFPACDLGACPPVGAPNADLDLVTIKLSGTFSHAAVSTVLNVTGGFLAATNGTAGMQGSLNLVGIPAGEAQIFYSLGLGADGIPNPSVCGTARVGVGPLEIGSLGLKLTCDGCLAGVVDALGAFAGRVASLPSMKSFVFDAIDETSGFTIAPDGTLTAAAKVNRSRPVSDYLGAGPANGVRLSAPEQVAVLTRVMNIEKIVARLPAATSAELTAATKDLLFDLNQAVAPELVFCGSVAPKLFGFPLSGTDVIAAHVFMGRIRTPEGSANQFDTFTAQLRFSPTWFLLNSGLLMAGLPPVIPGLDQADLGFSIETPTVTRPEYDVLFSNPVAFQAGRAQKVIEGTIATFGYELAPFGIRLGNGQARVFFPRLEQHPLNPARDGGPWNSSTRPPTTTNAQKLSRTDLLLLAAQQNRIRDPRWRGRVGELDDLVTSATQLPGPGVRPIPAGLAASLATQDLTRDYFPYGGVLAAGSVNFPNFIAQAPPFGEFAELFTLPSDAAGLGAWWTKAETLWNSYVIGTTEVGSAAIYLPAPNPPSLWLPGTTAPDHTAFLSDLSKPNLDAILAVSKAEQAASRIYAFNEILLQGYVAPQFFGMPVGRGELSLDNGKLNVKVSADTNSWLSKLAPAGTAPGASFDLSFIVDQPRYLERTKTLPRPSSPSGVLAADASTVFSGAKASGTVANSSAKFNEILDTLPRVSLLMDVGFQLPSGLDEFLGVGGSAAFKLFAFSPGFEPTYNPVLDASYLLTAANFDPLKPDPYTVARRQGGVGFAGKLNFHAPGFTLDNIEAAMSLSFGTGQTVFPRLKSRFSAPLIGLPGGFSFEHLLVDFDSAPDLGGDYFAISGQMTPIDLAPFLVVRSASANLATNISASERLGGTVRVTRLASGAATTVELLPAVVFSPLFGSKGAIFGADPSKPFTFSSVPGTAWEGTIVLDGPVIIRDPFTLQVDPSNPQVVTGQELFRVELASALAATVKGVGLDQIEITVAIPNGARVTAFPGQATEAVFDIGSQNTSCIYLRFHKPVDGGVPALEKLYYDSGTVVLNMGRSSQADSTGARPALLEVRGRVEFGFEPGSSKGVLGNTAASLDCGSVQVDRVVTKTYSVTNTGNALLVVDASVIANDREFKVDPARLMLPASGSGLFTVTFEPLVGGARTGSLRLRQPQTGSGADRLVPLKGVGTGVGGFSVLPASLAFGSVERGTFLDKSVVITNTGPVSMKISELATAAPFSIVTSVASADVPARGTQVVTVRYTPTTTSSSSGTLTFKSDGTVRSVPLTGGGVDRLWFLQNRSDRTLNSVAFATTGTNAFLGMAVGAVGQVLTTDNLGATWTKQEGFGSQTLNDIYLEPAANSRGFIVGDNVAYVRESATGPWVQIPQATDGGVFPPGNWRAVTRVGTGDFFVAVGVNAGGSGIITRPTSGSFAIARQSSVDGAVEPTALATSKWTLLGGTTNTGAPVLNDIYYPTGTTFMVAVGADLTVLQSSDGLSWPAATQTMPTGIAAGTDLFAITSNHGSTAGTPVWLAVGEGGLILRRLDTATSWTKIAAPSAVGTRSLRSVTFTGLVGYIAGDDGLVLRSADAGLTWTSESDEAVRDLLAVATVPSRTEAFAVGPRGEIHARFSSRTTGVFASVETPVPLDITTGASGKVFRTVTVRNVTGGELTYTVTVTGPMTASVSSVSLQPGAVTNVLLTYDASTANPGSGTVTILNGISTLAVLPYNVQEQSGGWTKVAWPGADASDTASISLSGFSTGEALLTMATRIVRSTNGGSTWAKLDTDKGPYGVSHFADGNDGMAPLPGAFATLFRSSLTGTPIVRPDVGAVVALDSELVTTPPATTARLQGLMLFDSGKLHRFIDSGTSVAFTELSRPAVLVDVAHRGSVFHAISASTIYRRPSSTSTWTAVGTSPNALRDLFFLDANRGWVVGDAGTVFLTTNGGTSWTKDVVASDVDVKQVAFATATTGWAVGSTAAGEQRILRSTDGGLSWVQEFSMPTGSSVGQFQHVAALNASAALAAGTDQTLWRRVVLGSQTVNYLVGPAQVDCGSLGVGEEVLVNLVLSNPGSASLTVSEASINEASSMFTTDISAPVVIPPGGAVQFSVRYHPRSEGRHASTLRVFSNASNGFVDVELRGLAERKPVTVTVDTQPTGIAWRLGAGTFVSGPRVFEVVAGTPGTNQIQAGSTVSFGTLSSATVSSRTYTFREWPGSKTTTVSYAVPTRGSHVLVAAFEQRRTTPPVYSDPVVVPANPCGSMVLPTDVGPGPWLKISDATLTLRGLDSNEKFKAEGALYLSLQEAYGSLKTSAWSITSGGTSGFELLGVTAGSWRFNIGGGAISFETETPGLRLFARPLVPASRLYLSAQVGAALSSFTVSGGFEFLEDANILPFVLQFGAGSSIDFKLQTSFTEIRPFLKVDGTLRLLRNPFDENGWLVEQPYAFEVGNAAPLTPPAAGTILDLGLLKLSKDAQTQFSIAQSASSGDLSLTVGGFNLEFLGGSTLRTPTATVTSAGRLDLSIPGPLLLGPVNAVPVTTGQNFTLAVDLRALGFALNLPQVQIQSAINIPGSDPAVPLWPNSSWTLAAFSMDFLEDFEFVVDPSTFGFHGLEFNGGAGADFYLAMERKNGVFGTRFRAFATTPIVEADVRFAAKTSGALSGRVSGALKFPPFNLEVARGTLDYSSARTSFQFRYDTSILGANVRFEAGTTESGVFGVPLGAQAGFR